MSAMLTGARVLVTGASGFVGRRLVERLVLECRAEVRVLVRTVMSAVPLARFPIEIVLGDMTDARAIERSVQGCRVIFNCAKGKGSDPVQRRAVDVDGATQLVSAARAGRARVVHVSTMAVYDRPDEGTFDERTPAARDDDLYTRCKLEGETAVLAEGARENVPVVVVQPSVIYGPYAWNVTEIIEELRAGPIMLVNGGNGICNLVYVDDVVTALILAATSARAPGERFLCSGPEYPTWGQFFTVLEQMAGVQHSISLSDREAMALWRRSKRRPWLVAEGVRALRDNPAVRARLLKTREGVVLRWLAKRARSAAGESERRLAAKAASAAGIKRSSEPAPIRPWVIRNMARRARVSNDKIHRTLGYTPAFNFDQGMRLTQLWARWAGLIP